MIKHPVVVRPVLLAHLLHADNPAPIPFLCQFPGFQPSCQYVGQRRSGVQRIGLLGFGVQGIVPGTGDLHSRNLTIPMLNFSKHSRVFPAHTLRKRFILKGLETHIRHCRDMLSGRCLRPAPIQSTHPKARQSPAGGGQEPLPGWHQSPSLPIHLRECGFRLGQPECHLHSPVQRERGG